MAIIRFGNQPFFRNPWSDLEKMRQEMDKIFRDFSGDFLTTHSGATVFPPLNISEDTDNIYVRAEVPGITAQDLDISVEGETLTIKGERKACTNEKASYHRREIECGTFRRAVTLPTRVEIANVQASSKNGILTITLPKSAEAKPKQITVRAE